MKRIAAVILCLSLCLSLTVWADAPACAVGDTVTFGTCGGEAIVWTVLEVYEDGSCLLLSKYGPDAKPYHEAYEDVTWESCSLRAWLNGAFLDTAFTAEERGRIMLSSVTNADNAFYGTAGGNDTEDFVYLLSLDEAERYFPLVRAGYGEGSEALICLPTETALRNGALPLSREEAEAYQPAELWPYPVRAGACSWWLRSPGRFGTNAAFIDFGGIRDAEGAHVNYTFLCVRPVIRVRL